MKELNGPTIVRMVEDADAAYINAEHEAGSQAQRKSLDHYRKCGERLIRKKASLKHGQWGEWLRNNVRFSQQMASRYMRFASALKPGFNLTENQIEELWESTRPGNAPKAEEEEPPVPTPAPSVSLPADTVEVEQDEEEDNNEPNEDTNQDDGPADEPTDNTPLTQPSKESPAAKFAGWMRDPIKLIWGIEEQFGSFKGMMDSEIYSKCSTEEKVDLVTACMELSEVIPAFARQAEEYAKLYLVRRVSTNGKK